MKVSLPSESGKGWLEAWEVTFHGEGQVLPRLVVGFELSKFDQETRVKVLNLAGRLKLGTEVLAIAPPFLGPREVHNPLYINLVFALSLEALAAVNATTTQTSINLTLLLNGVQAIRPGAGQQHFASELPAGQWAEEPLRETGIGLNIPVSDWYARVLEPIGTYRYAIYAVSLPKAQDAGPIGNAVKLLVEADKAYGRGHDVSVFSHCRGAWDVLPGNKVAIFDALITDPQKRAALDELGKKAGGYLHRGRHPADSGPQQGEFAIDHRDAELALNLTKLLVGYVSKLTPTQSGQ